MHGIVEIPAGACEKWEVKLDGVMRWDMKDGKPRHVKYLGYPCNYGMVPRTMLGKELGGDGDPLDVLMLGPAVPRGVPRARHPTHARHRREIHMTPRSAYGEAPSGFALSPQGGRHQRPGEAGSAVAREES